MSFELETNINAVVQALKDHNTTTASPYLSQSLTSGQMTQASIKIGDPDIETIQGARYPCIFVRVAKLQDAFAGIGRPGSATTNVRKQATVTYDVVGIYHKDGGHASFESLMKETYKFARNICGAFNAEFTLSNTALWCQPAMTSFSEPVNYQGGWAKGFLIELEATYLYR